ncbi:MULTISPECIES: ABC transporter ATP-binding protein [unclassified Paenibacillus]|uniref:energy-coupling factor ABC transporter ATP-binding protein n=1 Tax=unclassified Paenibacillus TaxID=185978 RepID=UPI001AE97569|nr:MULTISPECIES: ABC transporter ATP-binding protein [unclassified Paenibacillus]MBP1154291.1 cobalt/nickel transport system ATP-binding protein [Paenibacillus sp. PvP091]MBP1170324.1 cobalt/nickel transport system ATP-binding protein [Paenibacillus sp. PvR098]MBP2441352.1 cobalt/nickel transport system ATP-binding protein [Paenibacillus sp. PvP052]
MKSLMEAHDVRYSYPGTGDEALQGLTMSLPAGKKTAICGHNGSGKSTMFLHAIGIHRPAAGEMSWKGSPMSYRPSDLQKLRQQVGLVFQDPEHQLILSTPYEDISYGLRNAGIPEHDITQRTQHVLASMGLELVANTPIHHLSLGQKKRVALAGVMVLEPELLLLDEPTAYLDRLSERQLMKELNRIHESGTTVVMATHDMNLAYAWADWILVMDHGKCLLEGIPYDVFKQEDLMISLGLEPPMLLQVWSSLPAKVRVESPPPRSIAELKELMKEL